MPGRDVEILKIKTTGDKRTQWSLEKQGGKGLFTKELEEALLEGRAHVAVHSAKDLPTEMPEGLELAAFLPRENPHDVLVVQEGVAKPKMIATSSPRRRSQLKRCFPCTVWSEIRGNVDTRLKKVANGHEAQATILAAAGLKRLGIDSWPGLVFKPLAYRQMVPAVGQGAVALQTTSALASEFAVADDKDTSRSVRLERRFLAAMGGGCHVATAGFVCGSKMLTFHEDHGFNEVALPNGEEGQAVDEFAASLIEESD